MEDKIICLHRELLVMTLGFVTKGSQSAKRRTEGRFRLENIYYSARNI